MSCPLARSAISAGVGEEPSCLVISQTLDSFVRSNLESKSSRPALISTAFSFGIRCESAWPCSFPSRSEVLLETTAQRAFCVAPRRRFATPSAVSLTRCSLFSAKVSFVSPLSYSRQHVRVWHARQLSSALSKVYGLRSCMLTSGTLQPPRPRAPVTIILANPYFRGDSPCTVIR